MAVYGVEWGNPELVRTRSTIAVLVKNWMRLASNEARIQAGNVCSRTCAGHNGKLSTVLRFRALDRAQKKKT